ncbi:hypothetical protein MMC22_011623 [Lobaria immixta]|nr:hypothetical protein [Lobaria immixta]
MAASAPEKDVSHVPAREAIRDFQSFPLADLTMQRREELVISPPSCGDLHKVDFSRIEPYLTDPPLPDDASSRASTPDMTARRHSDYIFSATNGEPGFLLAAKEDKEQTMKDLAKASYKALRANEFPLRDHRLDSLFAPSYTKDVADQIRLAYGRAPLKAKTELHIGQMKMEIKHLRAVQSQYAAKVSALDSDIRTLKVEEAKADDEDRIVQRMLAEARALEADCDARKAALNAHEAARDQDVAIEEPTAAGNPAVPTPVCPAGPQAEDEYDDDEREEIEVLMAASR